MSDDAHDVQRAGHGADKSTSDPDQRQREEEFWGRYQAVIEAAGVKEGVRVWYRRHCERFIRYVCPKRLREAEARDVDRFLESVVIQRLNAHWTHEPGNVQRLTSNAQHSTKRFIESWTFGLPLFLITNDLRRRFMERPWRAGD